MKTIMVLALTLFGTSAMAQLQWTTETEVNEFDDSVSVGARLDKDEDTRIGVGCKSGEDLVVGIIQPERLQLSLSEEIEVRFDDEAIETISVTINENAFLLTDMEGAKPYGLTDPVELTRKLARHSKFRLRYIGVTLTFDYDQASAKQAITQVLDACGYELEPEPSTETATD